MKTRLLALAAALLIVTPFVRADAATDVAAKVQANPSDAVSIISAAITADPGDAAAITDAGLRAALAGVHSSHQGAMLSEEIVAAAIKALISAVPSGETRDADVMAVIRVVLADDPAARSEILNAAVMAFPAGVDAINAAFDTHFSGNGHHAPEYGFPRWSVDSTTVSPSHR